MVWAVPVSLAATKGIARIFFLNIMALSHQVQRLLTELMLGICSERNFRILLSIPLGTEMFHFPRYAPSYKGTCR